MIPYDRIDRMAVTDIAPEAGARGVARSGDGIVLDALREAGARGLSRQQIVDHLGCWGNEQTTTEVHSDEIDAIIIYLCELGVARADEMRKRYVIVTSHEMLSVKPGMGEEIWETARFLDPRWLSKGVSHD